MIEMRSESLHYNVQIIRNHRRISIHGFQLRISLKMMRYQWLVLAQFLRLREVLLLKYFNFSLTFESDKAKFRCLLKRVK